MQCRKLLICSRSCTTMTKCLCSRYETWFTFKAGMLSLIYFPVCFPAPVTVKIEVRRFKWRVPISQVVRVHAPFLIIKISFPLLATMWGVPQ